MITRWDAWFSESNLAQDTRILLAPPSQSVERAASAFLARHKRSILDLACGVGRDTYYLQSRGLEATGADASPNGLRAAQCRSDRGTVSAWTAADARSLPFRDASFDGVYCFGLLHEFAGERREADVEAVMSEVRRVLRDDGVLVLTVLAGEPDTGLPHFHTQQMFDEATRGLHAIEVTSFDDVGCTDVSPYPIWYGVFEKRAGRR